MISHYRYWIEIKTAREIVVDELKAQRERIDHAIAALEAIMAWKGKEPATADKLGALP